MMAPATTYLIAATGPFAFGWLHDVTAGWTISMASFLAITIIQAAVGFGAGRRGHLKGWLRPKTLAEALELKA
jgi:MFS transporter, CP family, cyanate transporter